MLFLGYFYQFVNKVQICLDTLNPIYIITDIFVDLDLGCHVAPQTVILINNLFS